MLLDALNVNRDFFFPYHYRALKRLSKIGWIPNVHLPTAGQQRTQQKDASAMEHIETHLHCYKQVRG